MRFDEIEREALDLPVGERARLAHDLIRSLEAAEPEAIESTWVQEAERRDREMDESGDDGVLGEEVLAPHPRAARCR